MYVEHLEHDVVFIPRCQSSLWCGDLTTPLWVGYERAGQPC